MTNKYNKGDKWGSLTFVDEVLKEDVKNKQGKREAVFKCDCGNTCQKVIKYVTDGKTKSCGCMRGPPKMYGPKKKYARLDKKSPCPMCGELKVKSAGLCRVCRNKKNADERKFKNKQEYAAAWQREKKYGISQEEFDALLVVFKGRCGICNKVLKMPEACKGQSLDVVVIDHDHQTGNLRGLLCNACNKGIGLLRDNYLIVSRAKEWLSYGKKISDDQEN